MSILKILGSSCKGPFVISKKINVPTILAKPVKVLLEFFGYYVLIVENEN